jgi:hypothetical protein
MAELRRNSKITFLFDRLPRINMVFEISKILPNKPFLFFYIWEDYILNIITDKNIIYNINWNWLQNTFGIRV